MRVHGWRGALTTLTASLESVAKGSTAASASSSDGSRCGTRQRCGRRMAGVTFTEPDLHTPTDTFHWIPLPHTPNADGDGTERLKMHTVAPNLAPNTETEKEDQERRATQGSFRFPLNARLVLLMMAGMSSSQLLRRAVMLRSDKAVHFMRRAWGLGTPASTSQNIRDCGMGGCVPQVGP